MGNRRGANIGTSPTMDLAANATTMTTRAEASDSIRAMLSAALYNHREAVLTTVDASGRPHATWVGTVTTPDFAHLITLTGSQTDKVANIQANPNVEWMFTSADRKTIIYFQGQAEVVVDETLKSRYFQLVPEESRSFFMKYYRHGGDWCVIKTRIDSATYCMPAAYTKVRLTEDQIRQPAVPS